MKKEKYFKDSIERKREKYKLKRIEKYGTDNEEEIKQIIKENRIKGYLLKILTEEELQLKLKTSSIFEILEEEKRKTKEKVKIKQKNQYRKCSICEEFREKRAKIKREYYKKNTEKVKEYQRKKQNEYYHKDPTRFKLASKEYLERKKQNDTSRNSS